jgi:subtilisin family serine protease
MGNSFFLFLLLSLSAFFVGCSKSPQTSIEPGEVQSAKVRTILQAEGAEQKRICQREVLASGGKILYANDMGLIFTDLEPESLKLSDCKAKIRTNQSLKLGVAPPKRELPRKELIPANEIGAWDFISRYPSYDGRGTVIAVLDTGIELDHPMLQRTTAGENKILDFEDFSGEGHVILSSVPVSQGAFQGTNGMSYTLRSVPVTSVHFGVFQGSSLKYASELSTVESFQDIGVITYETPNGLRGRIDTDGNGNFDDELELWNFRESRLFTKIGGHKKLTVSLNILDKGNAVNLCFADGSHGTHVSGIAAGYDAGGLRGVAPGAQVILGKIGDNRLPGGSTTTASMLLAIDFAVLKGAQIVNMSFGIAPGSNVGKSAIDEYVDKVAREKGILFSISAGNEGPGLLTVGVPAGASLAITTGAYVSKETAHLNYNYLGVDDDLLWYFSSIGPRGDGGLKPALVAPGTALSSVPLWSGSYANERGTSMASPQVAGGLSLLVSAAKQAGALFDRASVTHAVYTSAQSLPGHSLVEQGHGLMNVPRAFEALKKLGTTPPLEYSISINSPTSKTGFGAGIFVRSRELPPNPFNVEITPEGAGPEVPVSDARLIASAPWIQVDQDTWLQSTPHSFEVSIDPSIMAEPGLHSEKITAVDSNNNWLFEIPVTVVVPLALDDTNSHMLKAEAPIKVGHTLRYFVDVPAGSTALTLDLSTDGPVVWAQLVDPTGHTVLKVKDAESSSPMPPLQGNVNITRSGVYELDLVAPPKNAKTASVYASLRAYSLQISAETQSTNKTYDISVQNNFEAMKLIPSTAITQVRKHNVLTINGIKTRLPIAFTEADKKSYSKIQFTVLTSNSIYDLMTDYPYNVLDSGGDVIVNGGLETKSQFSVPDFGQLSDVAAGPITLEIIGSFEAKAPLSWNVDLTEDRILASPIVLPANGDGRLDLSTGQTLSVNVNLNDVSFNPPEGMTACLNLTLGVPNTGRAIQNFLRCQ